MVYNSIQHDYPKSFLDGDNVPWMRDLTSIWWESILDIMGFRNIVRWMRNAEYMVQMRKESAECGRVGRYISIKFTDIKHDNWVTMKRQQRHRQLTSGGRYVHFYWFLFSGDLYSKLFLIANLTVSHHILELSILKFTSNLPIGCISQDKNAHSLHVVARSIGANVKSHER